MSVVRAVAATALALQMFTHALFSQSAPSEQRIIADFQRRVSVMAERSNKNPQVDPTSAGWSKRFCKVIIAATDIQRTTSIVAPLKGIVEGQTEQDNVGSAPTREAAAAIPWSRDTTFRALFGPTDFRLAFDYRNGKWVLHGGKFRTTYVGITASLMKPEWKPLWEASTADNSLCVDYATWNRL